MSRTGASEVHVVSHMCRRATHKESVDAAEGKDDTEFIKVMNPAVGTDVAHFLNLC
jgi:hypothetical protein